MPTATATAEATEISRYELIERLFALRTASFVTIVAETDPRFLKKHRDTKDPNPWPGAVKRATVNGTVNWIYGNAVNRQRIREDSEPEFTPKPRAWGRRLEGSPFVLHKGRLYLEVKPQRILSTEYQDADGNVIPDDEYLEGFKPAKSSNAEHQGVSEEGEVRCLDYGVNGIREIRMGGERLVIRDW